MPHVRSVNDWLTHRLQPSLSAFLHDIKFSHTIFALPFAASALFLIAPVRLASWDYVLLLVCMVAARSFAMGFNRWADASLDAQNARTASRAIPSGKLSRRESFSFIVASAVLFCLAAASVNPLAGALSVPLLLVLALYSYQKRLGWFCHWYLGFCLAMAPVGVSVAVAGSISLEIVLLALAVMFWTGGFDVIYATQDVGFDRERGLHSAPVKFGLAGAMFISKVSFSLMIACLVGLGVVADFGSIYFAAVSVIAGVLLIEHYLVTDIATSGKSKHLNAAFFNANACISVFFFVALMTEMLL